jgi:mxaK protein
MKNHKTHTRLTRKNQVLGLLFFVGLVGSVYEGFQVSQIARANRTLQSGEVLDGDQFAFHRKFADAYQQGKTGNFKHASQNFGQLLEAPKKQDEHDFEPDHNLKSQIQFNIANHLFRSGLQRLVEADGSIQEQAKFDYLQARASYEQALRLNPANQAAKFNLSLLHGVIPRHIKTVPQDPSGQEISNLPQGLP